jgi:hypothetical protein
MCSLEVTPKERWGNQPEWYVWLWKGIRVLASLSLSIYLRTYLPPTYLPTCLPTCFSVSISTSIHKYPQVSTSIYTYLQESTCIYMYLQVSIHLSIYLTIYLSNYPSIYLPTSIYMYTIYNYVQSSLQGYVLTIHRKLYFYDYAYIYIHSLFTQHILCYKKKTMCRSHTLVTAT